MKALRKALHRPWVACIVISLLVLAGILGVRAVGWLQGQELNVYDHFVRWRSNPDAKDDRIAIVGMTEADLVKYGYPLDDAKLAQVLEGIDKFEPCVIGLDLYRDQPEPRSRELYPQLEAALKKLERVIVIERVGYFKAPPALADGPEERLSANNLEKDYAIDGYYRRMPLVIEKDPDKNPLIPPSQSFSLAIALAYLDAHGVECARVLGPGSTPDNPITLLRLGKTVFRRLTANAGGYVGLGVLDYEYLLDFKGPRRFGPRESTVEKTEDSPESRVRQRIHDYSFGDVIEGRIPPDALRGKIVLAATVMPSIKDSNPTPIDDDLRGVVQHAMAISQLLRAAIDGEKPMTWWPEWAEVAWIAVSTLLGGALGVLFRSPWKLAPALLLLLLGIHGTGWLLFSHGTWILVVAPALGSFIAATFVTSFIAYLELTERGAMQTIFSRHVSSKVVDELWANRDAFLEGNRLRPSRLTATVLFTDLKGFSTTSEKMDPATLLDWMNRYMDAIARHVDAHDGMVNKFIGDAIMAVFGAPIPSNSEEEINRDADNAVQCALAMEKTLIALNEQWRGEGLPTTEMRVGIYTGALVAGSLGTSERMEFTVLGDTVNTAARLESAGKEATGAEMPQSPCTILIGQSTFERLHGRYRTIPLGAMVLKGKAEKISVHRVIGLAQQESSI
ncbi:MAG: adenylate/guanylate cyclase domain-containing protein [Chthoniobacteraceae bacterium]